MRRRSQWLSISKRAIRAQQALRSCAEADSVTPAESKTRVVAFAGSLRRNSFNRALVRAAQELVPAGMVIELIEIGELPFYNADVEAERDPPSVLEFHSALRDADGVLIATPEYNSGIPALVTNAIDWGSRLPGRSPLVRKPVAVVGASPSQIGTARAQLHLRQLLDHVGARALPPPSVVIATAHERFDSELRLTHEQTREALVKLLERFARWIGRERAAEEFERAASGR